VIAMQPDRIQSVRRVMEREKIDALVAAASAAHSVGRNDPVFHLSGHRPLGPSLLVLRADGTSRLILSPAHDAERAAERSRATELVATDDPVREINRSRTCGAKPSARSMSPASHMRWRHASTGARGARAVDQSFRRHRGGRTRRSSARRPPGSRARLQRLLERTRRVGRHALDLGSTWKAGADDNFLMFNASPHNHAVQPSSTRTIAKGDIILAEITPSYRGQFTQICRTVSVGTPSNTLSDKYALVVSAMKEGIAAVKPGAPIGDACAGIDKVLSARATQYCNRPIFSAQPWSPGSMVPGDVATDNPIVSAQILRRARTSTSETGYLLCGGPVRVANTSRVIKKMAKPASFWRGAPHTPDTHSWSAPMAGTALVRAEFKPASPRDPW
jgi:hypothetical protein